MPVELTADTTWINPCFAHDDRHEHVSVYLVESDGRSILVDTGSFVHRDEIRDAIRETATDGVDTIILSHSDYPHAGNVDAIRDIWDADLVASSGSPAIQGLPEARRCRIGSEMRIENRTFSFVDPPLADRSHTTWVYDHVDRVLYTADGFGSYHAPGDCDALADDFDGGVPLDAITDYHADNLVWLRYVDPEKLDDALDEIFAAYPIEFVAPVHGHPVGPARVESYRERLRAAAERIADSYTVPT